MPQLDGAFSADNADFTGGVLTGNISSDTALYIYSGHQEDIELEPGDGGSVVVKSSCKSSSMPSLAAGCKRPSSPPATLDRM